MRPIHIAGFAQLPQVSRDADHDETESVRIVTGQALDNAGLTRAEVGFTCSGSNDYRMGRPFSFAMAIDGLGAWPPIRESHVEMDGAWALYEAWVALQHGDIDVALVYAFGRASLCDADAVHTLEYDPYTLAPLGVEPFSLAAMQARALLESGQATQEDFAAQVVRDWAAAQNNPNTQSGADVDIDALLAAPQVRSPLRQHDAANRTDGAAAIVLRAGGGGPRITGLEHRIDTHQPGTRSLTEVRSATQAVAAAGGAGGVEVAELHAPYSSQSFMLTQALGLDAGVCINPSGGAFSADTPMVAGLVRIGEAAQQVRAGAQRALAHATAGPLLQHNLVCIMEAS